MRLTDEMIQEDDKRFKRNGLLEVLDDFNYCGKEVPNRKSITNDNIRFYAWLCRSAYTLLKDREAVTPEREHSSGGTTWWNVCGNCKTAINPNDKFCHECGKGVKWHDI